MASVGKSQLLSPTPPLPSARWTPLATILPLLVTAVLSRAFLFGDPLAHVDDSFYLLVGQAMLDGQLPYVDIWDRKPFSLFLIYEAIAALGGKGTVETQVVAGLSAVLTAYVITRFGSRIASWRGGLLAGIVYLWLLPLFGGATGQSPVFYNLPMAFAGLLTLKQVQSSPVEQRDGRAIAAMLATGLAISIKPVAIFEGIWFGMTLLGLKWSCRTDLASVARLAAGMVATALLPPLLPYLGYAMIGEFPVIWDATIISVLTKALPPPDERVRRGLFVLVRLAPVLVSAAVSLRALHAQRPVFLFMLGWIAAAIVGLASVPAFFEHYSLPLLVPLCCAIAPLLARPMFGLAFAALLSAWGFGMTRRAPTLTGFPRAEKFEQVASEVRRNLHGCLYVYEGPMQLYSATGACRLTRFLFTDHLNSSLETRAVPVRQDEEIARIFRQRPSVVVVAPRFILPENPASRAVLDRNLASCYRVASVQQEIGAARSPRPLTVWVRRSDRPLC